MKSQDLLYLIPFMILGGMPVLIMLVMTMTNRFKLIYGLSLFAMVHGLFFIFYPVSTGTYPIGALLTIDDFSRQISALIIASGFIVMLISRDFLLEQKSHKSEYLIVLFVALLGTVLLVSATHFVSLFIALETLSIALFILVAYDKQNRLNVEAGVKYFVLASVSSAFLLFGMSLIYARTGSLEFGKISSIVKDSGFGHPFMYAGFGMIAAGLGFKLAWVPFHLWTPDVYQGAPVPVSAFIATLSKGSVLAVILRFSYMLHLFEDEYFIFVLSALSVLSMFIGNFLAIRQENVKRILAYSSVSNLGYLVISLLAGTKDGIQSMVFYLVFYFVTTLGAIGVLAVISAKGKAFDKVTDFRGLFWKHPWFALVFAIMMLSLAGIPLTAGFMAKFYLVFAGIKANLWFLVVSLVISSIIGLYYYLRIVVALFTRKDEARFDPVSLTVKITLVSLALIIVWLGIFPQQAFDFMAELAGF